ncbi:hypothetical protein K458DRAFT_37500 [Lentithecium fluviatile CBS 122367]|uniref:Uncharacterized protein n=1 Tax=Lentithecium fluviatile CBS 122367 TaxID=1168545 RepID=A0A6G1J1L0_9PLEO|nr:hypothetical protein K458DRAFT_37500 [Lentithecium fluviatile CBS 122367]
MEFQVQGSVLVNGEWVSRTADVYQIMARNQQQDDTEMQEPDTMLRNEVPELGILSRTVIESPFSRLVLPANIRHRELNDVLLVGEDSVHLKEIRDYGHLRHIASKTDFKGKILAARVFGEPRKVQVNTSELSPLLKHTSVHRGRRSTTGEEEASLPPEVIVLTLSSRTLMFLWASQTQIGPVTFRQKSIRLPSGSSRFDRPGHFLAVDPRCRAIAVAAHEGCFMIYKTKAMDKWREQTPTGYDEVPIVDEALVQIEGRIMHMEFLLSGGKQDDSHVVLAFILVHDGKTKLACYDWDCRLSLDDSSVRKDRSFVNAEDRNPSLLIPLDRSADFLLVCDRHISLYRRVLSGPPTSRRTFIQSPLLAPLRPGANKGSPRWVQWDRAPRNPDFSKEAFYIAREDGMVVYVERGQGDTLEVTEAGSWPYPIDTAFACINVDNSEFAQSYPDVLISGGAGSDGHLCRVGAWPKEYAYTLAASECHVFSPLESIPNWAPLTDLSITKLPEVRWPGDPARSGIFIANGEAPHGEVSELRHGLTALVDDSFGGIKGCTGVYIVDYGSETLSDEGNDTRQHYVTFIVAFPLENLVIRASRTQFEGAVGPDEPGVAWDAGVWEKTQLPIEDDTQQDHIIRDGETISACAYQDQYTIQITRKEARVLHRPTLLSVASFSFPSPLLQAATKPGFPFFVATLREADRFALQLFHIRDDGTIAETDDKNPRYNVPHDPSCIELLELDGAPHVFVGTIDAVIRLLSVDEAGSLKPVYEDNWAERAPNEAPNEVAMVCESAVLLTSRGRQQLMCGTRNGFVVSMTLEEHDGKSTHLTKMGRTVAQISPCATDQASAFVACGYDFCRIRAAPHHYPPIDIDSIWLVDRRKPAYAQGPLAAIDQLPLSGGPQNSGRNLGGFMLAVSGEQMVFAQLDYDVRRSIHDVSSSIPEDGKVIPRSLATTTTPKRLMYLEHLTKDSHKMAVATMEVKEERAPPNGYRAMHSSIKLINLYDEAPAEDTEIKQENEPSSTPNRLVTAELKLKHYERVYTMIEWTYHDRGHKYQFIVVGTGITEGLGQESGRRLFLKVDKSGLKLQKESIRDWPIRCLAVFDSKRIVMVVGKTLEIDEYDPVKGSWTQRGAIELPSPAAHISVDEACVFVSTTHDSHICYMLVPCQRPHKQHNMEFVPMSHDSRQRPSAHHLVYPLYDAATTADPKNSSDDRFTLLADKTCSVTGLFQPKTQTQQGSTDTLFEACLPRSVIRLHRGDVRPSWRRPCYQPFVPYKGVPSVLADDILGACSDGTIYGFSILTQSARRLLRLIQNLIEAKQKRDPALQYITIKHRSGDIFRILQNGAEGSQESLIKARDVDPEAQEKGEAAPRFKHVDGDLVVRFLHEDGDFERLVREGCDQDVMRLFVQRVNAVAAEGKKMGKVGGMEAEGTAFGRARRWVGDVVMPRL